MAAISSRPQCVKLIKGTPCPTHYAMALGYLLMSVLKKTDQSYNGTALYVVASPRLLNTFIVGCYWMIIMQWPFPQFIFESGQEKAECLEKVQMLNQLLGEATDREAGVKKGTSQILLWHGQPSWNAVNETNARPLANASAFWAGRVENWPGHWSGILYRTYKGHLFSGKCSKNLVSYTGNGKYLWTTPHSSLLKLRYGVLIFF